MISFQPEKQNDEHPFVSFVMESVEKYKGIAAALRRADNPDTEYQSWEYLAAFVEDLDKPYRRLPFATIAAAMVKAKVKRNGNIHLGTAIVKRYKGDKESNQAKAKLRRLLACDSVEEVCRVLRPLLSLISSGDDNIPLDYSRLLTELLKFHWDGEKIKSKWAQDFYRYKNDDEENP